MRRYITLRKEPSHVAVSQSGDLFVGGLLRQPEKSLSPTGFCFLHNDCLPLHSCPLRLFSPFPLFTPFLSSLLLPFPLDSSPVPVQHNETVFGFPKIVLFCLLATLTHLNWTRIGAQLNRNPQ